LARSAGLFNVIFSKNDVRKLFHIHVKRKKEGRQEERMVRLLHSTAKINTKYFKVLNMRSKTMKPLETKIVENSWP
jgi:hypothetical protein